MGALAAQGLAGKLDALGVVNETVEDGIGVELRIPIDVAQDSEMISPTIPI
ncbi:hypothetical protein IVB15_19425 [Bradyrhizobium sp. 182]|nr:hypothetical protein [Bradyrhizobium sp. 182]MCK1529836.1 hypothetical protein [Bradyrhizobium sp. 182]